MESRLESAQQQIIHLQDKIDNDKKKFADMVRSMDLVVKQRDGLQSQLKRAQNLACKWKSTARGAGELQEECRQAWNATTTTERSKRRIEMQHTAEV